MKDFGLTTRETAKTGLLHTPMVLATKVTLKMINRKDKALTDGLRVTNTLGLSKQAKWKAMENSDILQEQLSLVNSSVTST